MAVLIPRLPRRGKIRLLPSLQSHPAITSRVDSVSRSSQEDSTRYC